MTYRGRTSLAKYFVASRHEPPHRTQKYDSGVSLARASYFIQTCKSFEGGFLKKDSRGFSLLELIIYIAIVSVLSLGVSSAFLSFNRGRGQVAVRSEVNTNLRFAIEKITQDLHAGNAVTTPGSAGLATSTLSVTVSGTNVTYCVLGGQLRRQAGGACTISSEVITSPVVTVSTTTFTRIENTNTVLSKTTTGITIDLTIRYNGTNPDQQYVGQERATVNLQ